LAALSAVDNTIGLDAAQAKGIRFLVADQADVPVVPNLRSRSGNMLAKQTVYVAHAEI